MAVVEKSISGGISVATMSGNINVDTGMSGNLNMSERVYENNYEKLVNKPSINGVELIKNKSLSDLGYSPMKNSEILEIIKIAKGGI